VEYIMDLVGGGNLYLVCKRSQSFEDLQGSDPLPV
jgi:hypothetical protein